jgi:LPXTG-motif cell wall-anchored protein
MRSRRAIVRHRVRILAGLAVAAVLVVVLALPSGAQTTTTTFVPGEGAQPSPGPCTFDVTPLTVTQVPATFTASGTVPTGQAIHVTVFFQQDGSPDNNAVGQQDLPNGGAFSVTFSANGPGNVSANYTYGPQNAYTTGCATVNGLTVVRVEAQTVTKLAFTGSSNTPSLILIGTVALIAGLALVIAVRRRSEITNRP